VPAAPHPRGPGWGGGPLAADCDAAGAWRCVELRGEARLLRPLLVTGLKVWHLRPGGTFYPRAQFWHTLGLLPRGAQALLLLGEIDCREGLLLAVEKCRWAESCWSGGWRGRGGGACVAA
jgi:hypothetical protein